MVWDWSHTNEAYENAFENLLAIAENANHGCRKAIEFLVVCYAENSTDFDLKNWERKYKRNALDALKAGQKFGFEVVAREIWDFASELRLCSNGGHDCYLCRSGCHTVSFDRILEGC